MNFHEAVHDFKRSIILKALEVTGGCRTHAAERLGLQRTYLQRLILQLRLTREAPRARRGRCEGHP